MNPAFTRLSRRMRRPQLRFQAKGSLSLHASPTSDEPLAKLDFDWNLAGALIRALAMVSVIAALFAILDD